MTDEQTKEIRRRLDEDLSLDRFERDYRSTEEAATQFFQDLFVQVLNFEETPSPLGDATWQNLPVHEWPNTARAKAARLFAEAGNFRVIYVELETLTRTAERNAIQSLTRSDQTSGWAIDGSFLTVFHSEDEDIWHLVTPYEEGTDDITTGRPVLRRYTLGEGETHRTVANGLAGMDASKGRLAERIDEAFRVKPVTEDFYENYKKAFDTLSKELRRKGLEIEDADRYAHTTLNRLMFFYYLQKKGWIGDRKDFVSWFHNRYEESSDEDTFHEKWLSALFFDGMNQPEGELVDADLPTDVASEIASLPYMNGGLFQPIKEDKNNIFLSDAALNSVIRGFLEQYNFTVTEESPYDINVAVDPAMLGKIYESLIAEQERGEAGIFYTPRIEVDLMCRMALCEQFFDQANDLGLENKKRVVDFIFSEPHNWNSEHTGETEQLEEILHNLSIVDPACGSGAFLVGMKQVLAELYRKLGSVPDYDLKRQIINENLYGVDIKDWAVRVAEFRLWLNLVEDEDSIPDERPILPNFSFKIGTGDSIVHKVGGEKITLSAIDQTTNDEIRRGITNLRDAKTAYFNGELGNWDQYFDLDSSEGLSSEQAIETKQRELILLHLNTRIEELEQQTSQVTLDGSIDSSNESSEKEAKINQLKTAKDQIKNSEEGLFLWEITYPEVMEAGGFDIVIGNPPYVSSGEIIDQGINNKLLDEYDEDVVDSLRKEYREDLQNYAIENHGIEDLSGKSDLYVYFFLKGLELLDDGGTLSFVTSNSWLDVGFGERLKEYIIREFDLRYILGSEVQRSFEEADINTEITVINKNSEAVLSGAAQFTTFNTAYRSVTDSDSIWKTIYGTQGFVPNTYNEYPISIHETDIHRSIAIPHTTLWQLGGGKINELHHKNRAPTKGDSSYGGEIPESHQISNDLRQFPTYTKYTATADGRWDNNPKWSVFVRAPTSFFEKINPHLTTTLGDVADVHLGLTSGLNSFFYLDSEDIEKWGIESKYLRPLMKSPTEIMRYRVTRDDLTKHVLDVQADLEELPNDSGIKKYLEHGISEGVPDRPFFSNSQGNDWYVKSMFAADLVQPYNVDKRHFTALNDTGACVDKRLVCIDASDERQQWLLWAYLNSTLSILVKELYGRVSLGQGALENSVTDSSAMPTLDFELFPEDAEAEIKDIANDLGDTEIGTVFEEIAEFPNEVNSNEVVEIRRRLDKIVMQDALGLDEKERITIYKTAVQLVSNRIKKASSV